MYTFTSFSYSSSSAFSALILNPPNIPGSYSQDLSVHLHLHIAVIPLQPSSWSHINFKPNIPRSAEGKMCALPCSVYTYYIPQLIQRLIQRCDSSTLSIIPGTSRKCTRIPHVNYSLCQDAIESEWSIFQCNCHNL